MCLILLSGAFGLSALCCLFLFLPISSRWWDGTLLNVPVRNEPARCIKRAGFFLVPVFPKSKLVCSRDRGKCQKHPSPSFVEERSSPNERKDKVPQTRPTFPQSLNYGSQKPPEHILLYKPSRCICTCLWTVISSEQERKLKLCLRRTIKREDLTTKFPLYPKKIHLFKKHKQCLCKNKGKRTMFR